MSIDTVSAADLAELTAHRHRASISLYAVSGGAERSRVAHDPEAAQTAVRSAANEALNQLERAGVSFPERDGISAAIAELERDRAFWGTRARTVVVFAAPGVLRAFRLRNELPPRTSTGDRFDVGPLVRGTTFGHRGFVLALGERDVRLLELGPDASSTPLPIELPEEAETIFDTIDTEGRFDRRGANGALGPKIEQRRYCSMVLDAVLTAIGDARDPLVLAAAADLEPAYREVNTYRGLLDRGIDANPASLSEDELAARGRAMLEEHGAAQLAQWREQFGTLEANGRASTQLSDVARAASTGLVDTLLFDLASVQEGTIDEAGTVTMADEPGADTYSIVDELAARVLRLGGTARAVRSDDLPGKTPVAATFRGTL